MSQTFALIKDTFREAIARKIFLGLFGLATAFILFFLLLVRIDIAQGATATITLFGRTTPHAVDTERLVTQTFAAVSTFLFTIGMFLAVFASAGLIPSVLEPGRIELILSKPVARSHILLGRFAGNLLVVALIVTYLIVSIWAILGSKTGVWSPDFLFAIATTISIFAVLLTVVVLVGVLFESTALSTMVTVALMIVSPILAQRSTIERLLSSEWSRQLWRWLYYILPKPFDFGSMTLNLAQHRPITEWMPVWSSFLFGFAVLGLALYIFEKKDY